MNILLIIVTGTLNIVCFFIGAKVGQMSSRGEDIKGPTMNPVKLIKEHKEQKAADEEKNMNDTILHNIDCYDGTSAGQRDVPRR